jgi:AcrR family transcriptional regulator
VARWEPDALGRLEKAAMELFRERGYARTTVADIAERAGLTERTFFRYFADKREVLFSGSKELEQTIVDHVENAPEDATPLDAVVTAFEAAGAALQARRDLAHVRARHAIVVEHAEVQERELIKLASLAAAVKAALEARAVAEPAAALAAEMGITVFKVGFERWVSAKKPGELAAHIRAVVDVLKAVTAGAPAAIRPRARAPERPKRDGRRLRNR